MKVARADMEVPGNVFPEEPGLLMLRPISSVVHGFSATRTLDILLQIYYHDLSGLRPLFRRSGHRFELMPICSVYKSLANHWMQQLRLFGALRHDYNHI